MSWDRRWAVRSRCCISILACCSVLTGSLSFAKDLPLKERHNPSGLNGNFTFTGSKFADYITSTRGMIANARGDLNNSNREYVIDGNSPFEEKPPHPATRRATASLSSMLRKYGRPVGGADGVVARQAWVLFENVVQPHGRPLSAKRTARRGSYSS